jgi:tetratricopeptide (TPR) repeat protein
MSRALARALPIGIGLLVLARLGYHASYLLRDPFALATFSDGHLYERAARDLIAHPPLGSEPFYLQGLYAAFMALPLSLAGHVVAVLWLQIALSGLALFLLHRAASAQLGKVAGGLGTLVLLGTAELAFYENKYLSVSLGASCNMLALAALLRLLPAADAEDGARSELRPGAVVLAGMAAGLSLLARPNMLLALPFYAAAVVVLARSARLPSSRPVLGLLLGCVLVLAPMALRNQLVLGRPDVFPSHGGAIPFFIGNNPHANGRWNTAGGLLTGQVDAERRELAHELGLTHLPESELDEAIGDVLREKALAFIGEQPGAWLALEARKLWYAIGNHRFVRDYDLRGEAELVGRAFQQGLPFGLVLSLGALGFAALWSRARHERAERARWVAWLLIAGGQLFAVLAANLIVFTSAQNRMPLVIPLALLAGPGLLAALALSGRAPDTRFRAGVGALGVAGLLLVQSFWPRLPSTDRPSSAHYYNLATVEETIGRHESAAEHYGRAASRNPTQPMFHYNHAQALLRLGRTEQARAALDRLDRLPDLPDELRAASAQLRARLAAPGTGSD